MRVLIRGMVIPQTNSARAAESNTPPDAASALCGKIRGHLERRREELCREIGDYPPPRPACDAHFNKLLEERALVFQELARFDALLGTNLTREQLAAQIREFVSASPAVDEATRLALIKS